MNNLKSSKSNILPDFLKKFDKITGFSCFLSDFNYTFDLSQYLPRWKGSGVEAMNHLHLHVNNEIAELTRISESLEDFFASHNLPASLLFDTNLVIEEIFSNIVFYAFPDGGHHPVDISLELSKQNLTIRIEDEGVPFDPTHSKEPEDLDKPLEEREIGGLGIHLVKKMMTRVHYERRSDKNTLTLTRKY